MSRWLVLCQLLFASLSEARCLEEWACWETVRVGERLEFWVENRRSWTITTSLEVTTRNLQTAAGDSGTLRVSRVLRKAGRERVLVLEPVQPGKRTRYRDLFYWLPGDMDARHEMTTEYQYPFSAAESYPVVQGFGGRYSHHGASRFAVDFAMPIGTPVHAARAGIVVQTVDHHRRGGASRRYARYANYIVILHDDGTTGEYFHLQHRGVVVAAGERVQAGDHIGYSGDTGFSSLPHLHFAVYRPRAMGEFESLPFRFAGQHDQRNQ